jgi:hypothetical protein
MHERVVDISFAGIQLPRVEGMQAFVVTHNAVPQAIKAGEHGDYKKGGVKNQLPIEHKKGGKRSIKRNTLGQRFTFSRQGLLLLTTNICPKTILA